MLKTFSRVLKTSVKQSKLNYVPMYNHTAVNKVCNSSREAVKEITDGSFIGIGGFGICGIPENLIRALNEQGTKDLTLTSNNGGVEDFGIGILLKNHQVKRLIASYVGENKEFERQYLSGELEVELIPQGTLAERLRSAGMGIPAFYTPAGYGTFVQSGGFPIKLAKDGKTPLLMSEPREIRVFNQRPYLMEYALKPKFALIRAHKGDTAGNLIFRGSSRNFNEDMARAAEFTIAEVEEIVEAGQIGPDEAHLPGIHVDRIVKGEKFEKRIEKLVFSNGGKVELNGKGCERGWVRERIGRRAAKEIKDGDYVNLGIGMPTLIPNFVEENVRCVWQSEIGILGVGPYPKPGQQDADYINAGKESITVKPGATFFSSSDAFGIMRGHHLDTTIIGGMQVSKEGDLANWIIPGKLVKGMGGAMDLVTSGSKVIVIMEHCNKQGSPKILNQCTLPLTGKRVVNMLITEKAVFEFRHNDIFLTEIAKESSLEDIKKTVECDFHIVDNLATF
eukprot:CAMPEP_0176424556 /NCGR_PEP_ID=MMETSP0127-20121128/10898_1 /TAXON_ID=938130 /ORGANISM="Platyophrya macrostoma, Strain WH" /LENGTH=505 /DNA_ID=CAMNT_0017805617 /DNA_START=6 /DNA_END=1523 /DNA_ORIENTATION=+